jgi:hypothetical protein
MVFCTKNGVEPRRKGIYWASNGNITAIEPTYTGE